MEKKPLKIRICLGSSCYSRGNAENLEIMKRYLSVHNLPCDIDFRGHLCNEHCTKGPVIEIDGKKFFEVTPVQMEKILSNELGQSFSESLSTGKGHRN